MWETVEGMGGWEATQKVTSGEDKMRSGGSNKKMDGMDQLRRYQQTNFETPKILSLLTLDLSVVKAVAMGKHTIRQSSI